MNTNICGHEIFEMALQIERKGQHFYSAMAQQADNVHLRDGFHWLANDEKKHIADFEKIRRSIEKIKTSDIDNWAEVSLYFNALIDTKVFPASTDGNSLAQELKDEIGSIHISISIEKDTILFLQELSRWVNPGYKKNIEKLIAEEKGHILKLLQMKKEIIE